MPVKNDIVKAIHSYIYRDSVQYAIMIDGAWGIGKTHFIRHKVIPLSPQVEFIYLSLYGIKSLEKFEKLVQSKLEAVQPVVSIDKSTRKMPRESAVEIKKSVVLMREYYEFDSGSDKVISSPVVLCLDDLERWNGDLDDCLSYVNQLVEHKNFKCILIGNIDEISGHNARVFANAREKTIRHIYHFENSFDTIFDIALTLPNYHSKVSRNFLRSIVKKNQTALQRLLDYISVKNIRTIGEALQLYDFVFRRHSNKFKNNRNLAFAYLMALLSALILVNKFLLTKNQRERLLTQDHTAGKGFKYLSEIGYFDENAPEFLTDESRYLLDTIFYRMDQISLQGIFSIVRNGYYIKTDFESNFDNWTKQQTHDSYLDKEKFYQLDDEHAAQVFTQMYSSLVRQKSVTNPVTLLLLAERIVEDMDSGVIDLNPVEFKKHIIATVDDLYNSGQMLSVKVSIFDLSGDRFSNCRGIYNHVIKRNHDYQRAIQEQHIAHFWNELMKRPQTQEVLMASYEPTSVFTDFNQVDILFACMESLGNDRLFQLISWIENGMSDLTEVPADLDQATISVQSLVEEILTKYQNETGIRANQFRRLARKLKESLLEREFRA